MLSAYAWTTLGLWAAAFVCLTIGGRSARQNVRVYGQAPLAARLFKVVAMLVMFIVIYFPGALRLGIRLRDPGPATGSLGVLLCAAGLLLVVVSRITLGRNWSDLVVLKQDHRVVKNGPYRWVRHPLYSGTVLALLGSAFTVSTPAAYFIPTFCFFGLLFKSRKEEALLSRELPAYAEYRRRTKAFIPHVL